MLKRYEWNLKMFKMISEKVNSRTSKSRFQIRKTENQIPTLLLLLLQLWIYVVEKLTQTVTKSYH